MSKKIIVIITVLSIVMTMVILPIFSSAAIPSDYKTYTLTNSDFVYLYNNGYLLLKYSIVGTTATTELTQWSYKVLHFANDDYYTFYTPIYPTSGVYSVSMEFALPFDFKFANSNNLVFTSNFFDSAPSRPSISTFLDSDSVQDLFADYRVYSGFDFGASIWGRSSSYSPYLLYGSNFSNNLIDKLVVNSRSTATSESCSFFSFMQGFSIYISDDTYLRLSNQAGFDVGGDPSDPGGDPSDPGTGSVDFTPLIGYLESLDSGNQSTLDDVQLNLSDSSSSLSSSSDQALDFFNESESLKTDIIGSTEDYDSFLDSLDLSEEISVSYDGDSYTFDPMQGLDLIGGRIKSLFSFPLFYFIIFMLFFLALASYVIYGRA